MTQSRTILAGEVCRLLGVPAPAGLEHRSLHGVSTLSAASESDLAYVAKEKYADEARASRAGLLLVSSKLKLEHPAAVSVPNVMEAAVKVMRLFHPDPEPAEYTHPSAVVAANVKRGDKVFIGPNVVIEEDAELGDAVRIEANCFIGRGCRIGAASWLSANVSIQHKCQIGKRVRLHSGVVIGADGFRLEVINGRPQKIPQIGIVVIEDDVEIGANSTVDRASLTETRVGARTKIDNLVHIGHNVIVGTDCVIVAQVGIGGSTRIGRGVVLAGGVGIKDNLVIGDGCRVGGRSGVQNNLPAGSDVMGYPAVPVKTYARFIQFYKNFPKHWTKLMPLLGSSEGGEQRDDQQ